MHVFLGLLPLRRGYQRNLDALVENHTTGCVLGIIFLWPLSQAGLHTLLNQQEPPLSLCPINTNLLSSPWEKLLLVLKSSALGNTSVRNAPSHSFSPGKVLFTFKPFLEDHFLRDTFHSTPSWPQSQVRDPTTDSCLYSVYCKHNHMGLCVYI